MTPKKLCLILDYTARSDLRQACEKGYINRSHRRKYGVRLLEGLGLIKTTKALKTMYRYEPTKLGYKTGEFLPSGDSEWNHVMSKKELVYGDGTTVDYDDVPRYSSVVNYDRVIRDLKQQNRA